MAHGNKERLLRKAKYTNKQKHFVQYKEKSTERLCNICPTIWQWILNKLLRVEDDVWFKRNHEESIK